MRPLSLAVVVMVSACGVFGSDKPPTDDGSKPPEPIDGKPIEAIYVSVSHGVAGGDGSIARPFNTIKEGMIAGKARNLKVLVCAELISESIELVEGVLLYGSYDCTTSPWARKDARTLLRGTGLEPAILAVALVQPTRVDGFDIEGPNMTAETRTPAVSSYGFVVRSSQGLVLDNLVVRGGVAQDGKDGQEPAPPVETSGELKPGDARPENAGCSSQSAICLQNKTDSVASAGSPTVRTA